MTTAAPRGAIEQLALVDVYTGNGLVKVRDSLLLTPSFGVIWYTSFDPGVPTVKEAVTELAGSDGTIDETSNYGSRSVSLSAIVLDHAFLDARSLATWNSAVDWNSASWWLDYLSGWMHVAKRPRLYLKQRGSKTTKWMDLAPRTFSVNPAGATDGYHEVQLQWVCPSGKLYGFNDLYDPAVTEVWQQRGTPDGRNYRAIAQSNVDVEGRAYPETAPYTRDYPAVPILDKAVLYEGTVPNTCIIRMQSVSGSMIDPRVTVTAPDGTETEIGINYTVTNGDFVEIDTAERTVTLNGTSNLASYVEAPLRWPVLKPGFNILAPAAERRPGYNKVDFAIDPTSTSTGAYAEVLWSSAYLQ